MQYFCTSLRDFSKYSITFIFHNLFRFFARNANFHFSGNQCPLFNKFLFCDNRILSPGLDRDRASYFYFKIPKNVFLQSSKQLLIYASYIFNMIEPNSFAQFPVKHCVFPLVSIFRVK